MLKTVRCYSHAYEDDDKVYWEEVVTYDDRYWEYTWDLFTWYVRYRSDGNYKVPEKPKGMIHCHNTFEGYRGDKLDLSSFDTSDVTDMRYMFYNSDLKSLDLSSLDTSNVTNMASMFYGCDHLQFLDLSSFDTSKVTDMSHMFLKCKSLQSLDLSSFDTSNVTDMYDMFFECKSLQSLDLSSFDTSKVEYKMANMFYGCESLEYLDLSSFDTSSVINMAAMFYGCKSLKSLDLSSFDTSNVTDMHEMFYGCKSLKSLDLSSFDTSKVEYMMVNMFYGCESLEYLDLSHFGKSNVTDDMLSGTGLKRSGRGIYSKKPKKPIIKSSKFKGNDSLDGIFKEIDKLFHEGNASSPKALIDSLRDTGFSDPNIVGCIFNRVESGLLDKGIYMPVIDSYIEKYIQPEIVRNLSNKSVGEVLDILYSRYSESIVNKAMCSYLRPQYLVD